ncbi:hypothetical protein ACGK9U_01460 [Mariniflexile sp. HNIBRBA6329]|uniref:hypothetical protein n=1 Tax=Mariniflexile sp. HNIBRBA6329 TaxID=3373088 RepID=UPI003745770B
MHSFYLKFDSKEKNIDFTNAVSIDDLAEILKSLYSAISANKTDNIVLSQITDNCYKCGFTTPNEVLEERFIDLNKDILEKNNVELTNEKLRYKKSIVKVIKPDWYLEILNSAGISVLTIPHGFSERTVDYYYSNKSFEGYITLIGDKELNPKHLHIYLSDTKNFKIFINPLQHEELATYYRKSKIRAKVRLKKSLDSDRILSAELISYRQKSELKFPYNLNEIDLSGLNFVFE